MMARAERMMDNMRDHIERETNSLSGVPGLGKGQFIKQTYHRKGDQVYQTKAHGAIDGNDRIVERQ